MTQCGFNLDRTALLREFLFTLVLRDNSDSDKRDRTAGRDLIREILEIGIIAWQCIKCDSRIAY